MVREDLNLEELEWSDDEDFEIDEATLVRSTVETLRTNDVNTADLEATKVIPVAKVNEQVGATDVQEILDIIDTQYSDTVGMPERSGKEREDLAEDMEATRVIPTRAVSEAVAGMEEIELTAEEAEELEDLTYHDEDVSTVHKKTTTPQKHPNQARSQSAHKKPAAKTPVRTGNGKNIKVQQKKKNAFEHFIMNLSWMDAVIALTGVLAAAVLIFVLVFWIDNRSKVHDLGEFSSIGLSLSELDTIGRNGINRIVSTSGGDVIGEAFIPSGDGQEEAIMVSVSFTSIEKDLKIKFSDKANAKLIEGIAFEIEVVTPSNETLTWTDDDRDGMIYKDGLAPGAYMVIIKSVDQFTFPSDATKVMVKDKISYQVINILDEIKTEDEINVAIEDTQDKDKVDSETLLADTVKWVATKKELSANADGYAPVDKSTITDPSTLTSAAAGGFWKVNTVTVEVGKTASLSADTTGLDSAVTYSYAWSSSNPDIASVTGDTASATVTGVAKGENVTITCTITNTATQETAGTQTFTVTVQESSTPPSAYVESIALDKTSAELKVGGEVTLTATVTGTGEVDKTVTWTTSNADIATVENGVVKAKASGDVTITATTVGKKADGTALTATCTVKVIPAGDLSLKVNANTATVLVGETYTIVPTVENFVTDKTVTYTVDKTEIATVDANGVVTGVAKGTAVVTVKTVEKGKDGKELTLTVTITVKANPKKDTTTPLKDSSGNQIYIKDASGKYVQAKWADYYTATAFYIEAEPTYTYYGWWTLNGKTYYFDENGKKVTGEQVISGVKYNFASDGSLSMNGGVLGIDVSKWQGTIDWNAVKNSGISFVVIRCGYRGSSTGVLVKDPNFETNIKGATKAGLKVGLYFFSQAVNEKEAVEEASMTIALAQNYKISYPIFIDTEWTSGGRANSISKETRTAVCKAFCETIKGAGYTPGVYACKSWYQDSLNVSTLNAYKIWLAQYASQPTYSNRYDMWQYTDKGKVNGINTNVDMNISYLGY